MGVDEGDLDGLAEVGFIEGVLELNGENEGIFEG